MRWNGKETEVVNHAEDTFDERCTFKTDAGRCLGLANAQWHTCKCAEGPHPGVTALACHPFQSRAENTEATFELPAFGDFSQQAREYHGESCNLYADRDSCDAHACSGFMKAYDAGRNSANDEIERLRAENERIAQHLDYAAHNHPPVSEWHREACIICKELMR